MAPNSKSIHTLPHPHLDNPKGTASLPFPTQLSLSASALICAALQVTTPNHENDNGQYQEMDPKEIGFRPPKGRATAARTPTASLSSDNPIATVDTTTIRRPIGKLRIVWHLTLGSATADPHRSIRRADAAHGLVVPASSCADANKGTRRISDASPAALRLGIKARG